MAHYAAVAEAVEQAKTKTVLLRQVLEARRIRALVEPDPVQEVPVFSP